VLLFAELQELLAMKLRPLLLLPLGLGVRMDAVLCVLPAALAAVPALPLPAALLLPAALVLDSSRLSASYPKSS
jgi:hypothetical protein